MEIVSSCTKSGRMSRKSGIGGIHFHRHLNSGLGVRSIFFERMRAVENSNKEQHIAERLQLDLYSGLLRQNILGNIKLLGITLGCFPPQEEDLFMSGQIVEER